MRTQSARLAMLLAFGALLGGCRQGGISITNTSAEPISFTRTMPGGEVEYTLQPGSVLELPAGSRIKMSQYTIQAP